MSEATRTLARPAVAAPPRPRVPARERRVLSNGLQVVSVRRPGLPQVAMRLTLPAGAAAEPSGFPGTASLVGALLTEGTSRHTAEELNALLDGLGASLGVHVGHDFVDVDLVLLAETLAPGLALLTELVTSPALPGREVERVRAESLDALEARLDEPANLADDATAADLFGAHPYGRLAAGTPEGIERVTVEMLADFHTRHYRPAGSFLVVAGELEPAKLVDMLEGTWTGWKGEAPEPAYPPQPQAPAHAGTQLLLPWPDAAQGEIRVAGVGLARSSPEWVTAAVANYILGGSTITGRLGANLREDKGWTYGVRSGFAAGLQRGSWAVDTAVDAEVAEAAVAEIVRELERFAAEPVAADELRRAKDALILSLPRAFETPARIVGRFGTVAAYGLPDDYWETFPAAVEAVTADDVLDVARRYFSPERLVRVVVGAGGS